MKGDRQCHVAMEQDRRVKARERDKVWDDSAQQGAAGWAALLPPVRAGNVFVRSVAGPPHTLPGSPAIK